MRMNHSWNELFPNTCALIEVDGDGNEVGTCCYYAPEGICPRHGEWIMLVTPILEKAPDPNEKKDYLGRKVE